MALCIINVITKAATPVLAGELLEAGQHINAAGSNALSRRELDEVAVRRASNVERDLAPISVVALTPFVLVVHPAVPARNAKELFALARSQPGRLNYGSVGIGSPPFINAKLLKQIGLKPE